LRIIAGCLKGKPLNAPAGLLTRPVTDRIKESLFNIWQDEMEGAAFLDLFAGSGSMGLEAFSRGAAQVVMVEHSWPAVKAIRANLSRCGAETAIRVLTEDIFAALQRLEQEGAVFDFVFIDPPFAEPALVTETLDALAAGALAQDAQVIIRAHSSQPEPKISTGLTPRRTKRYGESTVYFYYWGGIKEDE
jgi:16S rRNA (guanine(966)-N(2))-methyltransferase RsmD